MSDTNERKPLLSDEELDKEMSIMSDNWIAGRVVRAFYEAKITSGELMVVRLLDGNGAVNQRPTDTWTDCPWLCDDCGTEWMMRLDGREEPGREAPHPAFCPGCGAKIVEG